MFSDDLPFDPEMDEVIRKLSEDVKKRMKKTLGLSSADWDVRFDRCRKQENNVGSFLADLMRECVKIFWFFC